MLQKYGVLQLTRTLASNAIFGLRSGYSWSDSYWTEPVPSYHVLMALHRSNSLPFKLEEVANEVAALTNKGAIE